MTIRRITYSSPINALDALVRLLATYEKRYKMSSSEFYTQYKSGKVGDSKDFIEWAGDYQHYIDLKREIEQKLSAIA